MSLLWDLVCALSLECALLHFGHFFFFARVNLHLTLRFWWQHIFCYVVRWNSLHSRVDASSTRLHSAIDCMIPVCLGLPRSTHGSGPTCPRSTAELLSDETLSLSKALRLLQTHYEFALEVVVPTCSAALPLSLFVRWLLIVDHAFSVVDVCLLANYDLLFSGACGCRYGCLIESNLAELRSARELLASAIDFCGLLCDMKLRAGHLRRLRE